MDQEAYDKIVATLGQEFADEKGLKVRKPRVARTGLTVRALRAVGAGGVCPMFGLDFNNNDGVHHPADCGKEHDGKFAKAGNRSMAGKPGSGFEGHMEWVNNTDPKVILAAKKAAKAAATAS
jgi:hypothetical protein